MSTERVLQVLSTAPFFWMSKEKMLKSIHPTIGRRALSETLSELVNLGLVKRLDRHGAPPFFRIRK